jgi:pyruvate ferredoxin oxidoreductase alpha subunit
MPDIYTEAKVAQNDALLKSKPEIIKAWKELGDLTGRHYNPVETYKTDGAETIFLTMGSIGETVAMAVDDLRDQGNAVGLIKLRLWRPFPFDELRKAAKGAKQMIVIDRAISYGGPGGPVASEVRSVFYGDKKMPAVTNFICGLAGRDVTPDDYKAMYEKSQKMLKGQVRQEDYVFYGVRE